MLWISCSRIYLVDRQAQYFNSKLRIWYVFAVCLVTIKNIKEWGKKITPSLLDFLNGEYNRTFSLQLNEYKTDPYCLHFYQST